MLRYFVFYNISIFQMFLQFLVEKLLDKIVNSGRLGRYCKPTAIAEASNGTYFRITMRAVDLPRSLNNSALTIGHQGHFDRARILNL